jgi:lysophospholipase L1-like esterase
MGWAKTAFLNLILISGGILSAVLAFEGLSSIPLHFPKMLNHLPAPFKNYARGLYISQRSIVQLDPKMARYDREVFYTLRPGQFAFKNLEYDTSYSVNSAGFRDTEASLQRPRIVVLGDSFAMGWGVSQSEAFPKVLERLTGEKVLNAAISSYATAREASLIDRIDTSEMHTLVIEYCNNDLEENEDFYQRGNTLRSRSEKEYSSLVHAQSERTGYYPGKYALFLFKWGMKYLARMWLKAEIFPEPGEQVFHGGRPEIDEASLFLNALSHASRKDLRKVNIIAIETTERGFPAPEFRKQMIERVTRRALPENLSHLHFLDVSDILTADHYFVLDDHLTSEGHALIAKRLASQIANQKGSLQ